MISIGKLRLVTNVFMMLKMPLFNLSTKLDSVVQWIHSSISILWNVTSPMSISTVIISTPWLEIVWNVFLDIILVLENVVRKENTIRVEHVPPWIWLPNLIVRFGWTRKCVPNVMIMMQELPFTFLEEDVLRNNNG